MSRKTKEQLDYQLGMLCLALGIKQGNGADKGCLTIDGADRKYRIEYVLPDDHHKAVTRQHPFGEERYGVSELHDRIMLMRIAIGVFRAFEEAKATAKPKPDGITIEINEAAVLTNDMAVCLRRIADLIDEGYTSGIEPSWTLHGEEQDQPDEDEDDQDAEPVAVNTNAAES